MTCPDCGTEMYGHQYAEGPEVYDGISEWVCPADGVRIGRWSKRRLQEGEYEPRYGRGHVARAPGEAWE